MKTVLKMTKSQYAQVRSFVPEKTNYALLGQVRWVDLEIDVVLLTIKQFKQLKETFKKMGIIK